MKAEVRKTWLRSIENKNKRNEGMTGDCEREERLGNNQFIVFVSGAYIGKMKKNEIHKDDQWGRKGENTQKETMEKFKENQKEQEEEMGRKET